MPSFEYVVPPDHAYKCIRRVLVEIYGLHCHGVLGDVCHSSKTILFHRHQAAGRKHTRSRPPFIFTAPAPVRHFFLPSFSLHASHMTALSGDRDIRGPHEISRSNRVRSPGLGSITRRSNRNTVSQTVSDWTLVSLWRLTSTSLLHPYQKTNPSPPLRSK